MAPTEEPIQPSKLIPPYAANVAGSRKTPEPTMFPTTSAVVVHKPILAGLFGSVMDCILRAGKIQRSFRIAMPGVFPLKTHDR